MNRTGPRATVLIFWGGINTVVGNLVLGGAIESSGGYDRPGMIGHEWLWGRVVLTCWEPIDRADPRVPDLLRQVDLGAGPAAAGFDNIVVSERLDWHEAETAMWREVERLNPGSDAALTALHEEAIRALAISEHIRAYWRAPPPQLRPTEIKGPRAGICRPSRSHRVTTRKQPHIGKIRMLRPAPIGGDKTRLCDQGSSGGHSHADDVYQFVARWAGCVRRSPAGLVDRPCHGLGRPQCLG